MDWHELAGLAGAYGASYLSQLIDGAPRPFSASYAVTNRCNIHCSYCSCPSLNSTDLPLPQVGKLFSRLADMGVRRVGLVGGEPLLREDFGEIVALARGRDMFVTVNTNLMLYERHASDVARANVVFTSLDGDPAAHRRNRGQKSFDGVLEAITDLCARGKRVVAICVLTAQNLEQTDYLLALARRIGFQIHFQAQCLDAELVRPGPEIAADGDGLRAVWRRLIENKRSGFPIASSLAYLQVLAAWKDYRVPAYQDSGARCSAGRAFLYVDAQGTAYPCPFTKGKTVGVDLLNSEWNAAFDGRTPCTRCFIGPMLEMNLLFERPAATVWNAVRSYAG